MSRVNMSRVKTVSVLCIGLMLIFSCVAIRSAEAIPALQLYIEGSTYDTATETWVTSSPTFKLWVIGDVGHYGDIYDVKLSAAYSAGEAGGTITITPTTTSLVTDISTPAAVSTNSTGNDGQPLLGNGSKLPTHGIYDTQSYIDGGGTPTVFWNEYALGNFDLRDSPIGDFIDAYPTSFPDMGQINVYDVTVTGFTWLHFDAYDHIVLNNNHLKYKFAPFSHDGETKVPEPGTALLLGTGLLGLVMLGRKKKIS